MNQDITLDPEQEQAAALTQGPSLVLAGAGAGKTATLTERMARMIEGGVASENVLMLTFSRKAAREMYARLRDRLDISDRKQMPSIENFHSFGWKLLQANPKRCQRRSGVSLMDDADRKKTLRRLHKELADDDFKEEIPVRKLMTIHDVLANDGIILGDRYASSDDQERKQHIIHLLLNQGVKRAHWARLNDILRRYEEEKRENNLVDFGDLIVLPGAGLRREPEWAAKLEERFQHIAVDEAQDTNKAQYDMLRLFSSHNNVMMVGDDDQCIYEWRGANPGNLKAFLDETNAAIVRLERNYRSSPSIVSAAAAHIAHNNNRITKSPFANERPDGDAPDGQAHVDGVAMANAIAADIRADLDRGINPKRIAVLYRVNKISRLLEPALISQGIPYRIAQGIDVFQTPEAQMLMAGVRLMLNPQDAMALERLAGLVKGLGEKSVNELVVQSQMDDTGLLESRENAQLNKRARAAADHLAHILEGLKVWPPLFIAQWALDEDMGGFQSFLKELSAKAEKPQAVYERRLGTLLSIEEAIQSRFGTTEQTRVDAEYSRDEQWRIIQEMALAAPDEESDEDKVTLATVFRVKGLEYHTVHVAGLSEGLMPMQRASVRPGVFGEEDEEEAQNMEEERRLSYVAATRARERLVAHHARSIHWGYEEQDYEPSSFATEMGIEWREVAPVSAGVRNVSETRATLLSEFAENVET
ncbi:ATP-dependent helicase [Thioalkalivibrio sp. ALE19]|uniref:ATP-dependent helicase n=1 Tax=Thioalkalivibrio sp. ALE19 TaxID=1266909 RepID=UPI0004046615|nr:ATP-dependent helicase [Thioalkalivibrio sp. ALE19]